VPVEIEVDLQAAIAIANKVCRDSTRNEQVRRVSVVLTLTAVMLT